MSTGWPDTACSKDQLSESWILTLLEPITHGHPRRKHDEALNISCCCCIRVPSNPPCCSVDKIERAREGGGSWTILLPWAQTATSTTPDRRQQPARPLTAHCNAPQVHISPCKKVKHWQHAHSTFFNRDALRWDQCQ